MIGEFLKLPPVELGGMLVGVVLGPILPGGVGIFPMLGSLPIGELFGPAIPIWFGLPIPGPMDAFPLGPPIGLFILL